jgi:hypothetical protein
MDLPSSKFSCHERSISERSGSCPSSGATISEGGTARTDAVSAGPRARERGSVDGVGWSDGG